MKMPLAKWHKLLAETRTKAEAGDAYAQWELGSYLDGGLLNARRDAFAVKPNHKEALRWFGRSAEAGNAIGQVALGQYLSRKSATKQEEAEAISWFKRAMHQKSAHAAINLACVYRDRNDQRRAFFWYARAAKMGDGGAELEVGVRYHKGLGVRRDPKQAVAHFRRAIGGRDISQADREMAMCRLGEAYWEGCGVRQSSDKALEWLLKGNVDDDIPAARKLIKQIKRESKL